MTKNIRKRMGWKYGTMKRYGKFVGEMALQRANISYSHWYNAEKAGIQKADRPKRYTAL